MNMQNNSGSHARQVKQVLIEVLGEELEQFTEHTPLKDIYGSRYDSMRVIECVGAIEEKIGVEIDLLNDDLIQTFNSFATINELIQKKLADQQLLLAAFDRSTPNM